MPEGNAEAQSLHSATGTATTYTFSEAGNYTMTLTVTDNDPLPIGSGVRGAGNPPTQPIGTKAVPVPPQTTRREAARTYNLTVHASMIVRILPHPQVESTLVSESSLAIDTENLPSRQPNAEGEGPTTATIYYQVTGGSSGVTIFRTRVSLEIDDDQDSDSNPAYTVVLGENLYGTGLATTWDGKGTGNQLYGVWNAQIKVDIDFDKNTPEPEDYEWEQTYRSGFLPINVYSFPVADAGGNKVVAIDTTTNLVTVSFDGSNSYDPDDGTSASVDDVITAWNWSFTGTDLTQDSGSDTATTKTVDTPYRTAGVKTATLIVTDNDDPASDDDDTAEVTVIDINITAPVENAKIELLEILAVYAEVLPAAIRADTALHWSITIGDEPHSLPLPLGKPWGEIPIDPYPTQNSDFGPNTVTATFTYQGVSVSRDQPVLLFFDREGTENGNTEYGEDLPNWYHFWSQTPANTGRHRYQSNPPIEDISGAFDNISGDDFFYVYPLSGASMEKFARTCLHENKHKTNFDLWWRESRETWPQGGYNAAEDQDGDFIIDTAEDDLGFSTSAEDADGDGIADGWDSNNDGTPDGEVSAYAEEGKWLSTDQERTKIRDSANKQDWSDGGYQHGSPRSTP